MKIVDKMTWGKKKLPAKKNSLKQPKAKVKRYTTLPSINANAKGQMIMIYIIFLVMALIVFIALIPALLDIVGDSRGCDGLNCAGYIDPDQTTQNCSATNQSYSTKYETNSLGCTVIELVVPLLILIVLSGLIMKFIHGKMTESQPADMGYGGGYPGY